MLSDYRRRSGAPVATVREIFDRHASGDPHATAVLEETGRLVALSIVALQAILDLELIVLGGSIGVREELFNIITKQIQKHFHSPIEVAVTKLGNQAGLIGASVSAHRTLLQSMFGRPAAGANDEPERQDLQRSVSNLSSFREARPDGGSEMATGKVRRYPMKISKRTLLAASAAAFLAASQGHRRIETDKGSQW